MATIVIGGRVLTIPELNFRALKKIYPIVTGMKVMKDSDDLAMDAIEATIQIVSIALERSQTPMTPEEIEEAILQSELPGLQPAMIAMLSTNGMVIRPGEPVPAEEEAKPSTGTSTQ